MENTIYLIAMTERQKGKKGISQLCGGYGPRDHNAHLLIAQGMCGMAGILYHVTQVFERHWDLKYSPVSALTATSAAISPGNH